MPTLTAAQFHSLESLPDDDAAYAPEWPDRLPEPDDRIWFRRPQSPDPIAATVIHVWDAVAGLVNLKFWDAGSLRVEIDVRPVAMSGPVGWSFRRPANP